MTKVYTHLVLRNALTVSLSKELILQLTSGDAVEFVPRPPSNDFAYHVVGRGALAPLAFAEEFMGADSATNSVMKLVQISDH